MASTEDPGRQTYHGYAVIYSNSFCSTNACHYAELAFQLCSITINIKLRFLHIIRIPESENCCFWNPESKNLEFRLQLYESKFCLQLESLMFHYQGI